MFWVGVEVSRLRMTNTNKDMTAVERLLTDYSRSGVRSGVLVSVPGVRIAIVLRVAGFVRVLDVLGDLIGAAVHHGRIIECRAGGVLKRAPAVDIRTSAKKACRREYVGEGICGNATSISRCHVSQLGNGKGKKAIRTCRWMVSFAIDCMTAAYDTYIDGGLVGGIIRL